MLLYKNYTHASQSIRCKKSRIQERLFVPCSKPQLVYMSAPMTKQEICPRLLQSLLIKTCHRGDTLQWYWWKTSYNIHPIVFSRLKSSRWWLKAQKLHHRGDQLLLEIGETAWTAREEMSLYEEKSGITDSKVLLVLNFLSTKIKLKKKNRKNHINFVSFSTHLYFLHASEATRCKKLTSSKWVDEEVNEYWK